MVSFFLSRVALAVGFRQEHWVSSLLVGIFGLGSLAGERGIPWHLTQGWAVLAWIPRSHKDLKSSGYLIAFPEMQARPVLALGGGGVQFRVSGAAAFGHCLTPHTHPLPPLEARLPRVKRQPLHSRTSVPSCLLPGEWIAGQCGAGSVAQGHLPFVSLHFVLS